MDDQHSPLDGFTLAEAGRLQAISADLAPPRLLSDLSSEEARRHEALAAKYDDLESEPPRPTVTSAAELVACASGLSELSWPTTYRVRELLEELTDPVSAAAVLRWRDLQSPSFDAVAWARAYMALTPSWRFVVAAASSTDQVLNDRRRGALALAYGKEGRYL